jgi:hypothetical protein
MTEQIEKGLVDFLILVLAVLPFAGAVATVWLWRLWRSDRERPRSWVLFSMAAASTAIDFAAFVIAFLALRRATGLPPLTTAESTLVLAIVLTILESVPVYFGVTIYRKRRAKRIASRDSLIAASMKDASP